MSGDDDAGQELPPMFFVDNFENNNTYPLAG
jgi:hypothetical protein